MTACLLVAERDERRCRIYAVHRVDGRGWDVHCKTVFIQSRAGSTRYAEHVVLVGLEYRQLDLSMSIIYVSLLHFRKLGIGVSTVCSETKDLSESEPALTTKLFER